MTADEIRDAADHAAQMVRDTLAYQSGTPAQALLFVEEVVAQLSGDIAGLRDDARAGR